jgi:hypothetical protein
MMARLEDSVTLRARVGWPGERPARYYPTRVENGAMRCIECDAADVSERRERTTRGYRRFQCHACGKRFNECSGGILNRAQYPSDIIALVHQGVSKPDLFMRAQTDPRMYQGLIRSWSPFWPNQDRRSQCARISQLPGWHLVSPLCGRPSYTPLLAPVSRLPPAPPPLYTDLPRHADIARTRQTRATTSGVRQRAASANRNKRPDAQRRMT